MIREDRELLEQPMEMIQRIWPAESWRLRNPAGFG